jgi:hypothetical protein
MQRNTSQRNTSERVTTQRSTTQRNTTQRDISQRDTSQRDTSQRDTAQMTFGKDKVYPKKKYRMTADGVLKEKRSFFRKSNKSSGGRVPNQKTKS